MSMDEDKLAELAGACEKFPPANPDDPKVKEAFELIFRQYNAKINAEHIDRLVGKLNDAFRLDPAAIQALLCNRVPCNEAFANDSCLECLATATLPQRFGHEYSSVGALGMLNGALRLLGYPVIEAMFSDRNEAGVSTIMGFRRRE